MLRYHIQGQTRVVSLEPAGYASRPIRGFLPKATKRYIPGLKLSEGESPDKLSSVVFQKWR
jgi:hypothetical protein